MLFEDTQGTFCMCMQYTVDLSTVNHEAWPENPYMHVAMYKQEHGRLWDANSYYYNNQL